MATLPAASAAAESLAETFDRIVLLADGYATLFPLPLFLLVLAAVSFYKRRGFAKPVEVAFYTLLIPLELAFCGLLLVFCIRHTIMALYHNFHGNELLWMAYIEPQFDSYFTVGFMVAWCTIWLFVMELCCRLHQLTLPVTVHHCASLLMFAVGNQAICHTTDPYIRLVICDLSMLTLLYVVWAPVQWLALLARRLNDGYQNTYLHTPELMWRYRTKQLEIVGYILSLTFMPLMRFATTVLCVVYYVQLFLHRSRWIGDSLDYFLASYVCLHIVGICTLYATQWYNWFIMYKFLYRPSKVQQAAVQQRYLAGKLNTAAAAIPAEGPQLELEPAAAANDMCYKVAFEKEESVVLELMEPVYLDRSPSYD